MNVIEIHHLTKSYGKARGIVDVSFDVEEGEIFGFIGPNGAGKSTTIRTLLSLIRPTSGSATIFGKDCVKQAPEIAKEIGYLPSEVFYYDKMKVIDLLKYSASFYGKDCTKRIKELAEYMDLDLKRRIDDLSYGNRKKVGIVQGLLHEPKLIILDEPTGGLDPLMQHAFYALLRESRGAGQTVLLSSHLLPEVQEVCGRAAFVRAGRLIAVEDMSALGTRAVHEVEVVLARDQGGAAAEALAALPGVSEVAPGGGAVRCRVAGSMDPLVKLLARFDVTALRSSEPDLDDLFMAYYGEEQRGETADAE